MEHPYKPSKSSIPSNIPSHLQLPLTLLKRHLAALLSHLLQILYSATETSAIHHDILFLSLPILVDLTVDLAVSVAAWEMVMYYERHFCFGFWWMLIWIKSLMKDDDVWLFLVEWVVISRINQEDRITMKG